ncbi:acyl-CoA dehydrogenase family protein [Nocardia sp. NPDC056541]|uniref:acyl-CoA dehydrogenase family protein n=1 Tax=Nocardia sp. NPDC056541 TaxID=3345860 RepID=UPI00366AA21A
MTTTVGREPMTIGDPIRVAKTVAAQVLSAHAATVDREAVFPAESVAAIHEAGLLGAAVARRYGGAELSLNEQVGVAKELGRGCSASAMVWAMHQVQIACIARHHGDGTELAATLTRYVTDGTLVASITSEVGVGGSLRTSTAAVEFDGDRAALRKKAPTVSYGAHAGAYLVTARRRADADAGDQVAVLADASSSELVPTGPGWNPMGMRGTCSPAFTFNAVVPASHVLPAGFDTIAAATMVPHSHILWAAVWIGVAADAFKRAQTAVRKRGTTDVRLADAARSLTQLEALLADSVRRYAPIWDDPAALDTLGGPGLTMQFNDLKVLVSRGSVDVVELALEICGMAGYAEAGPLSVARHLRDLYSARLMIGNERLIATNTQLALLKRG